MNGGLFGLTMPLVRCIRSALRGERVTSSCARPSGCGEGRLQRICRLRNCIRSFARAVGLVAALVWGLAGGAAAGEGVTPERTHEEPVTIGLVDTFSPEFYLHTVVPTIEHLMAVFGEANIRVVELDWENPQADLARRKPAFVITSASTFMALIDSAGAHQIATRQPATSTDVSRTVASLFVTAASEPIRTLADARGRALAVSSRQSFDGWLIAKGEMLDLGIDPETHFSEIIETKYGIPDVATAVKTGLVGVGVLSTCEYELLERSGFIDADDLRILNEKSSPGACRSSTERYPDVVFSSLPNADPDVVNRVTVALLSMKHEGLDFRWSIANDFVPTMELLRTLRIGPFAGSGPDWTWERFWRTYRKEVLLVLALVSAVFLHIVVLNALVRRRTEDLRAAFRENERLVKERNRTRQRLLELERTNIVAQLSNMFAHEMKQPLTNITCYAGALKMLRNRDAMDSSKVDEILELLGREVERSSAIVEHVRSYAKHRAHTSVPCDLGEIVLEAVRDFSVSVRLVPEHFPECPIFADPFEIRFVVGNFLKNARTATAGVARPEIVVELESGEGASSYVAVRVSDNGPEIEDSVFESLGKVSASRKSEGLGFGLAIAVAVAERNGGHLQFEKRTPSGLCASLVLPLRKNEEKTE